MLRAYFLILIIFSFSFSFDISSLAGHGRPSTTIDVFGVIHDKVEGFMGLALTYRPKGTRFGGKILYLNGRQFFSGKSALGHDFKGRSEGFLIFIGGAFDLGGVLHFYGGVGGRDMLGGLTALQKIYLEDSNGFALRGHSYNFKTFPFYGAEIKVVGVGQTVRTSFLLGTLYYKYEVTFDESNTLWMEPGEKFRVVLGNVAMVYIGFSINF